MIMRYHGFVHIEHLSHKKLPDSDRDLHLLCSPDSHFLAANTAPRNKLWREREGKPQKRCKALAGGWSSKMLMGGGLLRMSVAVPTMGWSRPWGDGAGLWKLNSALASYSAWAWGSWPKTPGDLSALGLDCQPGPRHHQWQVSCQCNSVVQYCSSRSSVPPQNIEIKKSWEDPVLYHDYLLKFKSCGSSLTDPSR